MKEEKCTKCGNTESVWGWTYKGEENEIVLCCRCNPRVGARNSLAARTDIEMDTMSMQDSIDSFAK